MICGSHCLLFAIWFLGSYRFWGVRAQTSSASFQFPDQDGLTVNYIDTTIIQWTSNYAEAYLLMWCQNGTIGNNVVLGLLAYLYRNSKKLTIFQAAHFKSCLLAAMAIFSRSTIRVNQHSRSHAMPNSSLHLEDQEPTVHSASHSHLHQV